jgi:hypothetical protein
MANDTATETPAAPAAAPGRPLGGLIAPIAATVVLLGIGVGIGVYVANLLKGVQQTTTAAPVAKNEDEMSLESSQEIVIPDLTSNVRNQQGRRYIKVSCSLWMSKVDAVKLGFGGGGEGGKGGNAEEKRILQGVLEEHLKNYDLDDLTGPNIYLQLKKGFQEAAEKALRELHPSLPADHHLIERVVLTNLLVQ